MAEAKDLESGECDDWQTSDPVESLTKENEMSIC